MIKKEDILSLLPNANQEHAKRFGIYIEKESSDSKNYWFNNHNANSVVDLFNRVADEGLVLDGVHITIQSVGLSYDYVAYKNKMLIAYPDSKIDVQLVYKDDEFSVAKESGSVMYSHKLNNPLSQKSEDIIGGYCIIQNKRGEFLTTMSKEDLDQHRQIAKTDFIWKKWFKEMCLKTVIKKAVKAHFDDIYEAMEKTDNENYDLDIPLDIDLKHKQAIDSCDTIKQLETYYKDNEDAGKSFNKYVHMRKKQLLDKENQDEDSQ